DGNERWGLGTDGAASNNDLDMFGEMRTAALLSKGLMGDPSALPAETALRMATINNAKAMGIDAITGSLETGKSADLISIDLQSIETLPLYDPVAQIVYSVGRDRVANVWVAGQMLLKDRQLTTLSETDLCEEVTMWQNRIKS
ncbi:MAG TPA: TRZ/ATZ family hydrolase, partial [Gammaproteobacteria bacterium]|nr:TRZ/ATZ family hydrolase [Gammaproteobacteria bacterium]